MLEVHLVINYGNTYLASAWWIYWWFHLWPPEIPVLLKVPVIYKSRLEPNGCHFADIFKCIFLKANFFILILISLECPINNKSPFTRVMSWHGIGTQPFITWANVDQIPWCIITHRFFNSLNRLTTKIISKSSITGPLWGESTSDRWIPLTKGQ